MLTADNTDRRAAQRPLLHICSGGCEFFEAVYRDGRKIAGTGTCAKRSCGAPVLVGDLCLWSKPSAAKLHPTAATYGAASSNIALSSSRS